VPQESLHDAGLDWLRNARGVTIGKYRFFTPVNSSNASAQLQSLATDGLPGISIQDENGDGRLDSVLVVDSAHHNFSFTDRNGDGVLDSYEYTTGSDPGSKTFRDDDMDGQYELRVGPGRAMAVFVESQWRDVVDKGNEHFVELKGKLTRIEVHPVLRILDDK
jgi:hypothetical protein